MSSTAMRADPLRYRPLLRFLRHWRQRHQHPFNFWIHLVGIPMAFAGVALLFYLDWYWGVGAILLGYALQYLGHRVEGNDMGEWAGVKRLLGLPCVSISPRYPQQEENADLVAAASGRNNS